MFGEHYRANRRPPCAEILPFEDLKLWLAGNFIDGGLVSCRFEERKGVGTLPPCLFATLAILAELCADDPDVAVIRFVPARHIAHSLSRRTGYIDCDPQKVIKYVFRLRAALASIVNGDRKLGLRMIQSRRNLGYRIPTQHIVKEFIEPPIN